ncbi:MAG: DUF1559 domain-containing protein [Planctomycetaceae bacterium]
MPTCPICGAKIHESTRVCPACRIDLPGSRAGGRSFNIGGSLFGIVVGGILLLGCVIVIVLPIVQEKRGLVNRGSSESNLKNLALALHVYHDDHLSLPVAQSQLDATAAAHGWQTRILPYVEERTIHAAIDFDLPWDDAAHAAAFQKRIGLYLNPKIKRTHDFRGYALTHYAGNSHVLDRTPPIAFADITDGLANTILVGEVKDGLRAWGEPGNVRDPGLGLNHGPTTFGSVWQDGGVFFAAADGAVHRIDGSTPPPFLHALATPAGGERVTFPE